MFGFAALIADSRAHAMILVIVAARGRDRRRIWRSTVRAVPFAAQVEIVGDGQRPACPAGMPRRLRCRPIARRAAASTQQSRRLRVDATVAAVDHDAVDVRAPRRSTPRGCRHVLEHVLRLALHRIAEPAGRRPDHGIDVGGHAARNSPGAAAGSPPRPRHPRCPRPSRARARRAAISVARLKL